MQRNSRTKSQAAGAKPRPASAMAAVEALECRQLLSAAIVGALARTDEKFLLKADSTEQLQVELGSYAETHGVSSQVATFGTSSATNFSTILAQLDTLASGLGLTLSNTPDGADQATAMHVINQSGVKFDKAYTQAAVDTDRRLIAAFNQEAAKTSIPAIGTYITDTLAVLQINLEQALSANGVAIAENPKPINNSQASKHVATPTTYNKQGVVEVGYPTKSTSSTSTTSVNGVITVGSGSPFSSAAAQVGTGTANTVGVGTADSGTGVQKVVVVSNV